MKSIKIEIHGVAVRHDPRSDRYVHAYNYGGSGNWEKQTPPDPVSAHLDLSSQHDEDLATTAEQFLERELGRSENRRDLQDRCERLHKELEEARQNLERASKNASRYQDLRNQVFTLADAKGGTAKELRTKLLILVKQS